MELSDFRFHIVEPDAELELELIANWYQQEWQINPEISIEKIRTLSNQTHEFQVLMTHNGAAVCTGGLYNHVGILDKMPGLGIFKNWLALVYTPPEFRGKSYASLLCKFIQTRARQNGLSEMYLFTHTAESLYRRLDWHTIESFKLGEKQISVMKKSL